MCPLLVPKIQKSIGLSSYGAHPTTLTIPVNVPGEEEQLIRTVPSKASVGNGFCEVAPPIQMVPPVDDGLPLVSDRPSAGRLLPPTSVGGSLAAVSIFWISRLQPGFFEAGR
jgi:hypothetical protein